MTIGALFVNQTIGACSSPAHDFDNAGGSASTSGAPDGGDGSSVAGKTHGEGGQPGGDVGGVAGESVNIGGGGDPISAGTAGSGGAATSGSGGAGMAGSSNAGVCPNGKLEGKEQCDDNNGLADDGCTACKLDKGWACDGEPSSCHDVNECTAKTYDCSFYGTCNNTIGSYTCACKVGYQGDGHACLPFPPGLVSSGSTTCYYDHSNVKCWGSVAGVKQYSAISFAGLSNIAQISGGFSHLCALSDAGTVSCWGSNTNGETGDTSQHTKNLTPFAVPGLTNVVQLANGIGAHSCAVTSGGTAKCWGQGDSGQLGNGMTPAISPLVDVKLSGIVQIGVGMQHGCALLKTGEVQCWGDNGAHQLGDGTTSSSLAPEPVPMLGKDNAQIIVGNYHSCVLTNTGVVKCWGSNGSGEVGSTAVDGATPFTVPLPKAAKQVGLGSYHSCAILNDDTLSCWGQNSSGQIGTGQKTASEAPKSLSFGPARPIQVVGGAAHTCVLLNNGTAQCWGWNFSGQLGYNMVPDSQSPVSVVGLP